MNVNMTTNLKQAGKDIIVVANSSLFTRRPFVFPLIRVADPYVQISEAASHLIKSSSACRYLEAASETTMEQQLRPRFDC